LVINGWNSGGYKIKSVKDRIRNKVMTEIITKPYNEIVAKIIGMTFDYTMGIVVMIRATMKHRIDEHEKSI